MSLPESDSLSVEALAEEFLDRRRRGERPTLAEYAARYPELADEIREFFPVLGLVEDYKPASGDLTGSLLSGARLGEGPPLERLGDFRILREVGRGGMGVVYEAEQESLGRRVALKVLAGNRTLDPKLLVRFHREAKAAARLHHTNIVPVFGVGEAEGLHFYVMQFIQGLGLDQVLDELRRPREPDAKGPPPSSPRRRDLTAADVARSLVTGAFAPTGVHESESAMTPPPSARREGLASASSSVTLPGHGDLSTATDSARLYSRSIARIGLQAAEALEYAHEQGTLHRDIKPSNLLLDAHGTVWVADFGLAKVTSDSDLTHTGDIVGTIRYMAPERFAGRCDPRADVYALGLTLYELIAKRAAFEAEDRNTLIRAVTQGEPRRLRLVERSVPRDLETIVHKAIEKDPAHRYASAGVLAGDLRRFLEDRPITARRIGAGERLARWARRNPAVAALTAAVFGLLVLLAGGATISAVRVEREAQRARAARDAEQSARKAVEAANASLRATQDELRRGAYTARMNVVQAGFEAGDISRVAALLDQAAPQPGEPDLRGFEWYYWRRQQSAEASSRRLFAATEESRAFLCRDGSRVAGVVWLSSTLADIVVLDVASSRRVFTSRIEWSEPARLWQRDLGLVLNHDGTRLAAYQTHRARTYDEVSPARLTVWDVGSGRVLFAHDESLRGVISSSPTMDGEGTRVARTVHTSGERTDPSTALGAARLAALDAWDVASGRSLLSVARPGCYIERRRFRPGQMRLGGVMVEVPPRGKPITSIREWDLTSGQERTVATSSNDWTPGLGGFSYSPDGTRLAFMRAAVGDPERLAIVVLDATTGAQSLTTEIRGTPTARATLVWSPDGRIVAMREGSGAPLQLIDTATGRLLRVARTPSAATVALEFRSDGAGLVSIDAQGTVKALDLWPTALDAATTRSPSTGAVLELAIEASGSTVAEVRALLAVDPLRIVVRKTPRGPERGRIDSPRLGPGSRVRTVRLSPDGSTVAFVEYLYDYPSASTLILKEWRLTVADVVQHRLVQLSRREIGETIYYPTGLEFRPDGRALAVLVLPGTESGTGAEGQVQVRDVTDAHLLTKWSLDRRRFRLTHLAFCPDGQALAIPLRDLSNDSTRTIVQMHDLRDGRLLNVFEGDALTASSESVDVWDNPRDLVFAPDGSRVARIHGASPKSISSLAPDAGTLLIWDTHRPGTAPLRLAGAPSLPVQMAFSPDGRRIAAVGRSRYSSGEGVLRLWDTATGQELLSLKIPEGRPKGIAFSPDGRQLLAPVASESRGDVVVWDAQAVPAAIEASHLVDRLSTGWHRRAEVRAAVAAVPNLSPELRAAALRDADTWIESRLDLLETAEQIALYPTDPHSADARRALSYAEAAFTMGPDDEDGRYARGLARLRVSDYAGARADLEAAAQRRNDPATWGLLALAEIQLGHRRAAEAALSMMKRGLARDDPRRIRTIPDDLRRQAEALILDPIFPADPFAPAR